jgi:succinoglycan biosynthesis transport protein ExoP
LPEIEEQPNLNETVSRLVGMLTRQRWRILTPFCFISLATIGVLWLLPNRYTSAATLLVVQQQVPQRYVVPNSTTDISSALQAMKQEVLSRTQLLRMINDFGLYPKQRKRLAPEELVSLMLSNIDILPINENPERQKDFDAFRISFTTENALVAQQVTNTLTSLFINEYLRTGSEQATNTTSFLHDQVESKRKKLNEQEERLRDFKLRYVGELPEQQQGNLGILTGLQGQLQNTEASLNRAQQQRVYLQSLIEATKHQVVPAPIGMLVPTPGTPNVGRALSPREVAQNELARLEAIRDAQLAKGWKPEHPDMLRNQREIARAEAAVKRFKVTPEAETEAANVTPSRTASVHPPSIDTRDDPAVAQLKSNLEANRLEIDTLTNDEKRLKASISQYENRLNQTPVREQEQAGIVRDTEALRLEYADLLKKEQESQLATNLEKQQGGQQFRLVDPASLPSVPSSPKRLKMSLGGLGGGLFLGLAVAFLMEMRDTSFHTEKELTRHLGPPFVMGIPLLPTPAEESRHKWLGVFQWLAASAMVLVVMVAEFYVYRRG